MIISDKIYIPLCKLGAKANDLAKIFTYQNPEYFEKSKMGFSTTKCSPFLAHYAFQESETKEKCIVVPRGAIKKVKTFLEKNNISLRHLDNRNEGKDIDIELTDTRLEPQQLEIIELLKANEGGLIESMPGCITGDTKIRITRAKGTRILSIKSAYELFHGKRNFYHSWDHSIDTYVRSFTGEYILRHKIKNITYSGIKEVYKLELEDNKSLEATGDHKILTRNGWVKLLDLTIGISQVMCDNVRPQKHICTYKNHIDEYICNVKYHPFASWRQVSGYECSDILKHRLIYEANYNGVEFEEFLNILRTNEYLSKQFTFFDPKVFDIHHIDFNHFNNNVSNLIHLRKKDHAHLHKNTSIKNLHEGIIYYSTVKNITYCGFKETYDIECEDPHHNFAANDIIIHNSGKTIAALGFISEIKKSSLILVHEHRLRTQWEEELRKRLKGNFVLGRWDGDVKEKGDIVLGLINSVYLEYCKNKNAFNDYGIVIIDECHHTPARMFELVVNNIPAKYRIGLTGTVKRKDQKEILMFDILGPVLISIGAEDLKHRVTSFTYEIVETNCKIDAPTRKLWADGARVTKVDYVSLLSLLVKNQQRNTIILEKIIESIKEGYKPLILSDRVDHCKYLYQYLLDLGYNVVLLIGATRKQSNWEEIRQDNSIQAIVAQRSIAEEGLDYPSLSALHLTCPSTNLPKLKQRIGRIRRVAEDKILLPKVYDYADNAVQLKDQFGKLQFPLKRSARSRESFYKRLQEEYESA